MTHDLDFSSTVRASNNPTFTQLVLAWLTKHGPFWDDEREPNEEDYFEYQGEDVTDQGLGEAARRVLIGQDAGVFSFTGSIQSFVYSPLLVHQGLPEDPIDEVGLENLWTPEMLREAVDKAVEEPQSWKEVMSRVSGRYDGLIFSDAIVAQLSPSPFNSCVARRIDDLLGVLYRLVIETDDAGALTAEGMEFYDNHFIGKKAWFSDESSGNRRNFKDEMTFNDPLVPNRNVFCPWHGKIKTPQFRIHFEWPRPLGQREIKVVYIGPKITKA